MDFVTAVNRVLRYAADHDTVQNLLDQLRSDPRHLMGSSHERLVTADALQEHGRDGEAELLRSEHPIYFHQGRVHQAHGTIGGQNRFRRGYQDAAFFASTDHEAGEPLDENFGLSDLTPEAMNDIHDDAVHFYHTHHEHIPDHLAETAGHQFWFTRNGHGTGFRDHEGEFGDATQTLEDAAHDAGEYNLSAHRPDDGSAPVVEGFGGNRKWGQEPGLRR